MDSMTNDRRRIAELVFPVIALLALFGCQPTGEASGATGPSAPARSATVAELRIHPISGDTFSYAFPSGAAVLRKEGASTARLADRPEGAKGADL
jgi:hypothetical protein